MEVEVGSRVAPQWSAASTKALTSQQKAQVSVCSDVLFDRHVVSRAQEPTHFLNPSLNFNFF